MVDNKKKMIGLFILSAVVIDTKHFYNNILHIIYVTYFIVS